MSKWQRDEERLTEKQCDKLLWLADVHGLELCFIAERYGFPDEAAVQEAIKRLRRRKKLQRSSM